MLEIFDTFVFDRLYATILPAGTSSPVPQAFKGNATFTSMLQQPTAGYVYEPSSSYLSLEPSGFAYMSQWPRDNIIRQCISLFTITW